MSYFSWPDTTKLPYPLADFGGDQEAQVARTQMDSGLFRQRERFTEGMQSLKLNWELTDDQWALFQGIKKYKLANGADWFEMSLPLGGGGYATQVVRFVGQVSFQYVPVNYWKISATLETYTISPLSEAEVDAALA